MFQTMSCKSPFQNALCTDFPFPVISHKMVYLPQYSTYLDICSTVGIMWIPSFCHDWFPQIRKWASESQTWPSC
jgi:hypothetical protein